MELGGEDTQLYNPGIEIIGSVYSGSGTSSKQTDAALNLSLGDIAQSEFKTAIDRNVAMLIKDDNIIACAGEEVTDWDDSNYLTCTHFENSVLYFEGDVTLNLSELPSGTKTILVEGGDLYIKSNLEYLAGIGHSFGVIVLKDTNDDGGNIFVYPGVTNIAGAFYAEGSVISVNVDGECGEDMSAICDKTGFCDRSYELRNQLYWKGMIATQNTIGGADRSPLIFPREVEAVGCNAPRCATASVSGCSSREEARLYDLAYLRTFHSASDGTRAFADSDAAFVIEYDSRIQSNPPPLFEVINRDSGSGETGY